VGVDGDGIYVSASSSAIVSNASTGRISGYGDGVFIRGVAATVTNSGAITGTFGSGVHLGGGGTVTNAAGAAITGAIDGITLAASGSVSNAGSINGATGVLFAAGGALTNKAGAAITGSTDGVLVAGGNVTVTNAGTISGPTYAVRFTGGGNDTLIIDPGAVFSGKVNGTSAASALVLASAASVGVIAGLGTSFAGFKTVTEAAGAKWTVTGTNSLAGTTSLTVNGALTDTGSLTVAGPATVKGALATSGTGTVRLEHGPSLLKGSVLQTASKGSIEIGTAGGAATGVVTVDKGSSLSGAGTIKNSVVDKGGIDATGGGLTITGSLTGTGAASISSHSVLTVDGKAAVAGIKFLSGGHEIAVFATPTAVSSTLSGFAASDTIELAGFTATKLSFAGHTLTVDGKGGSVAHLNFAASYVTKDFSFITNTHGTNITFV
jgi:hypothetical protein